MMMMCHDDVFFKTFNALTIDTSITVQRQYVHNPSRTNPFILGVSTYPQRYEHTYPFLGFRL
jgi:hypothetical protein